MGLRNDVTALTRRISAIGLKFGGMMHSATKQIAISNGHAWPIFACSMELWNFQSRLGPGLRDDIPALTLWGFQLLAWNLVGWCTVPWSRLLLKMAMHGQFLQVPWHFKIFNDRLGPGRWSWRNHIMAAWCRLPWSGSPYEMDTLG